MPEKGLYFSLELVSPFEKSSGPMESLKVERVALQITKTGKPPDTRDLRKASYQTRGVERRNSRYCIRRSLFALSLCAGAEA